MLFFSVEVTTIDSMVPKVIVIKTIMIFIERRLGEKPTGLGPLMLGPSVWDLSVLAFFIAL